MKNPFARADELVKQERCVFCGKRRKEVRGILTIERSEHNLTVCNECVEFGW